jgi:hypothetical protein
MGLRADSKIELVTGSVDIATLRDQFQSGLTTRPVAICWTGQQASLVRLLGVRRLGLEQIFSVGLDDGNFIHASASSEFVMKSGVTKAPYELEPGDSLLPLYLGQDAHGYPTYQIPGRAVKRKLSRLAAEWKLNRELEKGTYVEHIDGDRKNVHPDNLRITVDTLRARRSRTPQVVKAYKEVQALFDECAAASPKLATIVGRRKRKRRRGKTNHKVMTAAPGRLEEVFTVIAESECSLSVSGVFLGLPS